ncbi:MAG: hypothetical protein IKZ96_02410 [Bacilli bacterium]|nr:hypothetical protein [Bacilli bacterium]
MEQTRYYYKSIPLLEYCNLKYLDYSAIMKHIGDKSKLVNGVTRQDLLDSLLATYELYEELLYGDELLTLYVVKNNRKYQTILDKIVEITKGDPNNVTDTIIDNVLFRYRLSKTKYFYKDVDLDTVAKQNNLNIFSLESDIGFQRRNFPKKEVQLIVNQVVENAIKSQKKYYYKNVPVKKWCETHYIDYGQLVHDANNSKTNPSGDKAKFYHDMLSNIEKYEGLTYGNILFITYCIQNSITYYTAIKNFIKIKEKFPDKSDEEVIKMALDAIKNHHGINKLFKEKKKGDKQPKKTPKIKEVKTIKSSDEYVEEEKEEKVVYKYKGFNIKRVCYSIGLSLSRFTKKINDELSKSKTKNIDFIIETIVMEKLYSFPELYIYNNKLLLDYCLENNIDYREVVHYIVTNEDPELSKQEKVNQAIKKYNDRRSAYNIGRIIKYLKAKKNIDINELKQVCDITDLDFKTIMENKASHIIRRYDLNDNFIPEKDQKMEELTDFNIVMLTWYFYDEKTEGSNRKYLSYQNLNVLLSVFEALEKNKNNKYVVASNSKVTLFLLIALYKSGLYRSSDFILVKAEDYISNIVDECWKNNWLVERSLVKQRFMEAVDSCVCSNEKEMLSYINSSVRARFGLPDREPIAKSMKYIPKKKEKKEDK